MPPSSRSGELGREKRVGAGRNSRHHGRVSGSVRSDPRRVRAARRAQFPAVRMRRPVPGRHHPASAADARAALSAFGAQAYYGVRLVDLAPGVPGNETLALGRLAGPGHVVLYDQPLPPWRLGASLPERERAWLASAGADVAVAGVVGWPGDSLRRFMLGHVLAHEIGHHIIQHERRLRGERAARTRDHEARAEVIATRLRERLVWP
jgi:hypothetical protein